MISIIHNPKDEETSQQFVAELIRREFDRVKSKELKRECIEAAEELNLNDLAEQMKYDLELQ